MCCTHRDTALLSWSRSPRFDSQLSTSKCNTVLSPVHHQVRCIKAHSCAVGTRLIKIPLYLKEDKWTVSSSIHQVQQCKCLVFRTFRVLELQITQPRHCDSTVWVRVCVKQYLDCHMLEVTMRLWQLSCPTLESVIDNYMCIAESAWVYKAVVSAVHIWIILRAHARVTLLYKASAACVTISTHLILR